MNSSDLRNLQAKVPKAASVLGAIFFGSPDTFARHSNDRQAVQKNLACFDDSTVSVLLEEARQRAESGQLGFAERLYEITQHVFHEKADVEQETYVAFEGGKLCEALGRFVGAMDWYDIARIASQKSEDDATWIKATIKYAIAGLNYAPGGLDWQLIPEVEKALPLAERIGDRQSFAAACKLLIQMYGRSGDSEKARRTQERLDRGLAEDEIM